MNEARRSAVDTFVVEHLRRRGPCELSQLFAATTADNQEIRASVKRLTIGGRIEVARWDVEVPVSYGKKTFERRRTGFSLPKSKSKA